MTTTTELGEIRNPFKSGCTEKERAMHKRTTSKISNFCRIEIQNHDLQNYETCQY